MKKSWTATNNGRMNPPPVSIAKWIHVFPLPVGKTKQNTTLGAENEQTFWRAAFGLEEVGYANITMMLLRLQPSPAFDDCIKCSSV